MDGQSGVSPEILPLPKGGGATRSIGETFSPDLHTGTGNYRIPLWFPRGPGKFQPDMGIIYSSGAGNGPFGVGWHLPVMRISRRTDRGLPTYNDNLDTFLLDGEEIVPVGSGRYRYRREEKFRRIERVGDGWEVRDKGGRRFILGTTASARIEAVQGGTTHVFAWLIEKAIDTNGNEISYGYHRDRGLLYIEFISYGIYDISFTYETRPDLFTERRAGFDITTALRCTSIEYRIRADRDPLFRRYSLTYDECPNTHLSLLASVTFTGYRIETGVPKTAAYPSVSFTYTAFKPSHRYQTFVSDVHEPPPQSLEDPDFDLVDLYGTGLPGVICLSGLEHRFWPNKGRGHWGPPRSLHQLPAEVVLSDPAVGFADLDGNGTTDLMILSESPLGYYVNEPGQGWTLRSRFPRAPAFNPYDPDMRLLDLNGDGLVDVMRTGQQMFYLHYNRGDEGWDRPISIARIRDLARFPDISFSDPRVKLADMTGDGLIDIVWVHGSRMDYWPHYGNGRFGPRITLALKPPIGSGFDPDCLFLSDINGDGIADVVYVESNQVRLWINQGGNALVSIGSILHTPPADGGNIQMADMLGSGTSGLIWSYPMSHRDAHNYKYMDFTGGVRPYLLTSIREGTGLVTEIEYKPSTEHAMAAEAEGRPWKSTLPFPVQTVSRIIQHDAISGTAVTRTIRYYDGFFDGLDREFCGFGRAEVLEEGDNEVPPMLTVSCFYQGMRGITPGATQELRRALRGKLYRLEVFCPDGSAQASQPLRTEENSYEVRELEVGLNGRSVTFPHLAKSHISTYERMAAPITSSTELTYDDYGNVIKKHERWDNGDQTQELITDMAYVIDTTRGMLNLPSELMRTDKAGQLLSLYRYYYDGNPFVGLPLGQVEKGNLTRREDMVLTDGILNRVYGAMPPDLIRLGYHRMTASNGEMGWGINGLRHAHDERGNVVGRMDAAGNIGRIIYDFHGIFPAQVANPLNQTYDVGYDLRAGEIARIAEPNGYQTLYRYDPVGRLTAMIKPGDSDAFPTVEFNYLDADLPLGLNTRLRQNAGDPDTIDTVEYFDGFNRVIQRRKSAETGQVIVDGWHCYNCRGLEAECTTPFFSSGFAYVEDEGKGDGRRYRFKYDSLGRIVETITPDARVACTVYRPGIRLNYDVSDTDDSPENIDRGHFNTPRLEEYDAYGRLLVVTEQNTGGAKFTTRYELDPLGHLLKITDARNIQTATYIYDLLGRRIEVEHVDAGRRRIAHDARGNLALSIDVEGRRTEISYDALGRQTDVRVDGAMTERYVYDAGVGSNLIGRLAFVEDEAGEVFLSYTSRGLIEEERRQVKTLRGPESYAVRFAYDSMERMVQVTHPSGSPIAYCYNNRGLLGQITGYIDDISYNAEGQITRVRYANGVEESYIFDPRTFYLQEERIIGPTRPAPYYQMSYTYDAVGNPLNISDDIVSPGHLQFQRRLTYDAMYRLIGASGSLDGAPFSWSYKYDNSGNFSLNGEFSSGELYLMPDGKNQIRGLLIGGNQTPLYGYDANGNLASTPEMKLEFDARSRLVRATKSDGMVIEYAYGYRGERVRKRVAKDGATKETIYIGRLFEIRNGTAIRFIFNKDTRIAEVSAGGETHFFHHDHLGNMVLITDDSGGIVQELGYYPFGSSAFSVGPSTSPYRFLGNEMDVETGLVYSRSRYYDPRLGRFISPDLFILMNPEKSLSLPASLNLYLYAVNNPMRFVDDAGGWWKWLLGGIIIAALVAATIAVGIVTCGTGFAFGILLAASIGSAMGSGIGVYSAWRGGGDLADGFLFGALVGGASGAAGYALGAAVGAAEISGAWSSILSGATEGAIVGAGNGAIIGYAGGAGTWQNILLNAAIGFGIGAVLGGALGYLRYKPDELPGMIEKSMSSGTASAVNPITGQTVKETYSTGLASVGKAMGGASQRALHGLANPVHFGWVLTLGMGTGSFAHAAMYHDWDDIKAWLLGFGGDKKEVIPKAPEVSF